MDHQRFAPVWLSTDEQLEALSVAYAGASMPMQLLGRFNVPPGTAYLRGLLIPWARIPLVFTAAGELVVGPDVLEFSPRAFTLFGWRVRGGSRDIQFRLARADVLAVAPADIRSPVHRYFDIPFTRVRTVKEGVMSNLLLCIGGRLSMGRVRARSMELRAALERFTAGDGAAP